MKPNLTKRLAVLLTFLMTFQLAISPVYAEDDNGDSDTGILTTSTGENSTTTELSEDVSTENVVEVVSSDIEDASDSTANELIDEAVEEVIDEIENMNTDSAVEAIENIEQDIEEEINSINEEIEKDPSSRARLSKKIQQLKDLLARLRAKSIKKHKAIGNIIRQKKNYPAVFEIRWGVLNRKASPCSGTDSAGVLSSLAANEAPEACNGVNEVEYNGTLSVDSGTLKVRKEVLFEKNDQVTQAEGSSITFDSSISGHWDSLIVQFIPEKTDDGSKPEINITVSIGDLNETYTGSEIIGKRSIGNNHEIAIKRIAQILPGIASTDQDKIIQNKITVQEKISNVREKIYRLRLLSKGSDNLDALETAIDGVSEYNFDETGANEVQSEINTVINGLTDNASDANIASKLRLFKKKIAEIKKKSKVRKFIQGNIPFKDTDDNEWYTNFVSSVKEHGIISGYKDAAGNSLGEFRPGNNITIAEILKIALETAGKGQGTGSPNLKMALNHWSKGYVKKAEDLGMSIVGDNSVDLNRPATRGEVIRLMLESFGIKPDTISGTDFSDVPSTHEHAAFIQYAKDLDIISGDSGQTTFRPDDPINRAEAAKIADQVLGVTGGSGA